MIRNTVIFAIVLLAVNSIFAIPQQINYQGQLTRPDGTPLDTTVAMTFRLYNVVSGGTASWTETHPAVIVTDGLFQSALGSVTTLPDSFAVNRWLGVTVGSNSEMTPRNQLLSVANAFRVATIDGANGGTITSDVMINNKINVGTDNTNSGPFANVHGQNNIASGDHSTVGGGHYNRARGLYSVVGGGGGTLESDSNSASGEHTTVSGGIGNTASTDYATVGGGQYNTASNFDATVGGGSVNTASGSSATVPGGAGNTASGGAATVGGGTGNTASGSYTTVSGGISNSAASSFSTVGGGRNNITSGNYATVSGGQYNRARGLYSVVGGGGGTLESDSNSASGENATVSGGWRNVASSIFATVGGGRENEATASSSTIGGGSSNLASNIQATVGGGYLNEATGFNSTVAGGVSNIASALISTVAGGQGNTASGTGSSIGGGYNNNASGSYATISGGSGNTASGDRSFAAGLNASALGNYSTVLGANASCSADSAFAWSDGSGPLFSIGSDNTFNLKANAGFRFWTTANHADNIGARLPANSSAWTTLCDSTRKHRYGLVDAQEILRKVCQLPIETWSYRADPRGYQHVGPMAQDFWNAFHLGDDSLSISTIDPDGIALAAIQGLAKRNSDLENEVSELKQLVEQMILLGHK